MNKEIKTEIILNGTKEKVWKVLTDFASYPEWNPFIVQIEGHVTEGTRLKNTLLNGGKKYQFNPVLLTVERGESFSWLGSLFFKGLFDGLHSFKLEDAGNGQVKLIHSERFSGLLSGYILKKIGNDTRNNFVKMNQALKERVESL
ncbi:SRPBCC domain-containing protein [Flavihumibacter sp. UBA7668]|uniref:SRPBCC domain-containing protein n=1 Tax=Flavihumibacter sp. UBA7668 TaxID=1946542 RepID=UPI0025BE7A28|nr:SRPBCC domain-containing protein [Flavihumibacter sp. UBA7668]